MADALKVIKKNDNFAGCPLVSGDFAIFSHLPFSPFPNERLACFSSKSLKVDRKNKEGNRIAHLLQLKQTQLEAMMQVGCIG